MLNPKRFPYGVYVTGSNLPINVKSVTFDVLLRTFSGFSCSPLENLLCVALSFKVLFKVCIQAEVRMAFQ